MVIRGVQGGAKPPCQISWPCTDKKRKNEKRIKIQFFKKNKLFLTPLEKKNYSSLGAGKMMPGPRVSICQNMVQFEGICLIHLPDLLFGNVPPKLKFRFLSVRRQYRGEIIGVRSSGLYY